MDKPLPNYKDPPLIETVLSVQFDPIEEYSDSVAANFWKKNLDSEWEHFVGAPSLPNQFELFGDDRKWEKRQLKFQVAPKHNRIQFITQNEEKMIQVQDTRFTYNWRKTDKKYPRYDSLLPEFIEYFNKFIEYNKKKEISLNQWEVTYVNHISKKNLWESVGDWDKVFLNFTTPKLSIKNEVDNYECSWSYAMEKNSGRLYIKMGQVKLLGTPDEEEVILLNLTARGSINNDISYEQGLGLGHKWIVTAFSEIITPEASKFWERVT